MGFHKNNQNIWITLDKIQYNLNLPINELLNHLDMTQKQFDSLRNRNLSPKITNITPLVDVLGISIESMVTGKIDYLALWEHFNGNTLYLPERYQTAAFSKRRTSTHLLNFIESNFGWRIKKNILHQLKLKDMVFQDQDSCNNALLPFDIFKKLEIYQLSHQTISLMGQYSYYTTAGSAIGNILSSFSCPVQLFEHVFTDLIEKHFDHNHHYDLLKFDQHHCMIESSPRREVQDLLHTHQIGSIQTCTSRGGSFASLTGHLNLPFCVVDEIECVFRGDASCKYLVRFPKPLH